jgi:hypothetical protein
MTATIMPPSELDRRRAEREQKRKECQVLTGSILDPIADADNPPCPPASPAREKETKP